MLGPEVSFVVHECPSMCSALGSCLCQQILRNAVQELKDAQVRPGYALTALRRA